MLAGGFRQPRKGRNNDKAHPPIHPIAYATKSALTDNDQKRVYEYVVKHFLACCSEDALGNTTTILANCAGEYFEASGLIISERNYLDVYPWDRWQSSQQLPQYNVGDTFYPKEVLMQDGKTSPPGYLTEPELIALMDANGIGTDATMAEHIEKIKSREYIFPVSDELSSTSNGADGYEEVTSGRLNALGSRQRPMQKRGRREVFIPSNLGVALVEAYDLIAADMSLSKPFLRKQVCLQGGLSVGD